jgi:Fe-S-cluster containining protein
VSTLLPVLRSEIPQMSLCSICPKPGSCCADFTLSDERGEVTFWKDTWHEDALAWCDARKLPFFPARVVSEWTAEEGENKGRVYVSVRFDCPELLDNGRCGIYGTRPDLCRRYAPLVDELCCLTAGSQR